MAPAAAPRRAAGPTASLACALLLFGCAAGTGFGGGSAASAPDRGRFNGLYRARQYPSGTNSASSCRTRAREIFFAVENGSIEMRTSRQRRNKRKLSLLGTVAADGSVAMREVDGGRSVIGRIEGDRFTAATVQDAQDLQAVQAGASPPCAYRYEGTRVESSAPKRESAAAGAPPVEGFPQP
jgi:hypothetical protein